MISGPLFWLTGAHWFKEEPGTIHLKYIKKNVKAFFT